MHQHVGQLINQVKGMRSSLWSVEEAMTNRLGSQDPAEVLELWKRVKASHQELRLALQLLADVIPDDDLSSIS